MSPNDALGLVMLLALLLPVFGWVWSFVILSLTSDYLVHKKIESPKIFLASLITTAVWFCLFFLHIALACQVHTLRYGTLIPQHDQMDLWLSMPLLILLMVAATLIITKFVFSLTWKESLLFGTASGVFLAPWAGLFYLQWFLLVVLVASWWVVRRLIKKVGNNNKNISPAQSVEIQTQPVKPWLKIVLFSILGLVLAGGLVFFWYWYVTHDPGRPIRKTQNLTPTQVPVVTSVPTPSPDETANWKTYIDKDDGFLFKYPNDWVFSEFPARDSDPKIIAVTSNVQGSVDTGPLGTVTKFMYRVSVSDYKIPSGQNPETYIKHRRMNGANIEGKMIGSYKVFINPESPSMRGAYAVYFERPNKTSYIEFIFDPYSSPKDPYPHQEELFSVYEKSLSTFKFLD